MALGSTQPLTEMSTRSISARKANNLTTILCRFHEIWEPKLLGTLWACPGLKWDCCTCTILMSKHDTCYGHVHKTIVWHDKSRTKLRAINIRKVMCVISGFQHEIVENCALLGHYAASSGNSLPTFPDNLSVPASKVKN